MTEPDVALTDYGLAIECAVLAYLFRRRGRALTRLDASALLFFGSVGIASLAGGTVHGFFLDSDTAEHAVLWRVVLLAIGAAAVGAWAIGGEIGYAALTARRITLGAGAALAGYAFLALFVTQEYRIAVFFYLPAAVFLFAVLAVTYVRARQRRVFVALVGLGLTFVAAVVQQAGLALHPRYFNHNALYHLIQAVALWLLFLGLRSIAAQRPDARPQC